MSLTYFQLQRAAAVVNFFTGMLHIYCGMEWVVDGIGVITEIPSQRYTVLHVDTTESDCLVHDATSQAPDEAVFTSTSSYQEYCGRFDHSTVHYY